MSIKKVLGTFADGFNGASIKEKLKEEGKEIASDFISGKHITSRIRDGFVWTWKNTDFNDWYNATKEATDFYDEFIRRKYREKQRNHSNEG